MSESNHTGPLRAEELVVLVDHRERRYLVQLTPGKRYHTHNGYIDLDDVVGLEEGSWLVTSGGNRILALRPLLSDIVLEMPRSGQVVYPKDLGAILIYGDIFPGASVVEAGLGSGALTMTLMRAVGERGRVVSYEVRQQTAEKTLGNVHLSMPNIDNLTIRMADVYEGVQEREVDRIVLDVPEPWRVAPSALEALVPGGLFLAFLPTALQVHELVNALRNTGRFRLVETQEVLTRSWHVTRTPGSLSGPGRRPPGLTWTWIQRETSRYQKLSFFVLLIRNRR